MLNAETKLKNELSSFTFNNTHNVRVLQCEGAPWFVATDICAALTITNRGNAYARLADSEKSNIRRTDVGLKPGRAMLGVSESGLYKLILRSNKPEALKFQDWITRDVLTAIRKDGGYIQGEEKVATGEMGEDELVLKALEVMQRKIARLSSENLVMAKELNEVTVDEFRALSHLYMSHRDRIRLGQQASALCRSRGIETTKQSRLLQRGSRFERTVFVKVYPRAVVQEAYDCMWGVAA